MVEPTNAPEAFERLLARALDASCATHEWLECLLQTGDEAAVSAVHDRQVSLSEADRERLEGLLETGLFHRCGPEMRVAALVLTLELENRLQYARWMQRCEPYSESQPLFRTIPRLFSVAREAELIPIAQIDTLRPDGVVSIAGCFARLDALVPAALVETIRKEFPSAPLWVRLDPRFGAREEPPTRLLEAIVVPADPKWWRTLNLRVRSREGGVYRLDEHATIQLDHRGVWDYRRGLRRLETVATRRDTDYLSMMFEELQVDNADLLLGRCVHLDTRDIVAKTPDTSKVNHLDLAINIYLGTARNAREEQHLRRGKVHDATVRTHLLRTEDIRLGAVIAICQEFFLSRSLMDEMTEQQFRIDG